MPLKESVIVPEFAGKRAADCVRAMLPDLPESVIRRIFADRDVKLDGKRVSRDRVVQTGQSLKIYVPDAYAADSSSAALLDVVYEDEDVLLVNKRAGISVEPDARGTTTLTDLCAAWVKSRDPEAFPPAACHRLETVPAVSVSLRKTRGRLRFCRMCSAGGILTSITSAWYGES